MVPRRGLLVLELAEDADHPLRGVPRRRRARVRARRARVRARHRRLHVQLGGRGLGALPEYNKGVYIICMEIKVTKYNVYKYNIDHDILK